MRTIYNFQKLRILARDQCIKQWYYMNKKQLCEALNLKVPLKFSLTNIITLEVTKWENSCSISRAFKVNSGCVLYALKVGKPLKTSVGSFTVKKLICSPEGI